MLLYILLPPFAVTTLYSVVDLLEPCEAHVLELDIRLRWCNSSSFSLGWRWGVWILKVSHLYSMVILGLGLLIVDHLVMDEGVDSDS